MGTLHQLLGAVEPLLKRCRPLARVSGQFMPDLAALLSGLRSTVMLDYAPGVNPQQLRSVLGVLSKLLHDEQQSPMWRQFTGAILHLEGCCYLANVSGLIQQLSTQPAETMFVSFLEGRVALLGPQDGGSRKLHQQLHPLVTALQQLLRKQQNIDVAHSITAAPRGTTTTFNEHCIDSSTDWDVLDLEGLVGLPAMPTLNGMLLGYPVVYWVQGYEEAVSASRELSMSKLQLFKIKGTCSGLTSEGRLATAEADGGCMVVLMAFSVPQLVCCAAVAQAVEERVNCMRAKAHSAACKSGWSGLQWSVEAVGPQAVSL